jgi:hypothetical protein
MMDKNMPRACRREVFTNTDKGKNSAWLQQTLCHTRMKARLHSTQYRDLGLMALSFGQREI